MALIKILDPLIASKIAAGEVVERPASVVKELIENSIDAGAASITVVVAEGGKRLIKVTDDGEGMSREDASLAFCRSLWTDGWETLKLMRGIAPGVRVHHQADPAGRPGAED